MRPGDQHTALCVTSLGHRSIVRSSRSLLILSFIVSSLAITGTSASASERHQSAHKGARSRATLVSGQTFAKASRVAQCEEGGWHNVNGPTYYGSLGWLWSTWQAFRSPRFPVNMADSTPQQQAWAMSHFVGAMMGGWWPDQAGCTGGY